MLRGFIKNTQNQNTMIPSSMVFFLVSVAFPYSILETSHPSFCIAVVFYELGLYMVI